MCINLQEQAGVEVIRKLASSADVFIQNFRPGVVEKLGLSYASLSELNPTLVYASISGAGKSGPYAGRRFYDPVIQAMAGYCNAQGESEQPELMRTMICDKVTALTAAQAITAALYARHDTGRGDHVEVSMLEASLYFIWPDFFAETFEEEPDVAATDLSRVYQVFETSDGYITVIAVQVAEFYGWCRAVGAQDLIDDPRCGDTQTLISNLDSLYDELREKMRTCTTRELADRLLAEDVPFGVVMAPDDIMAHPQVRAGEIVSQVTDPDAGVMNLVNRNSRFANSFSGIRSLAPPLGAQTQQVLTELGYAETEIKALRKAGAIN